jgi:hypothetical protein
MNFWYDTAQAVAPLLSATLRCNPASWTSRYFSKLAGGRDGGGSYLDRSASSLWRADAGAAEKRHPALLARSRAGPNRCPQPPPVDEGLNRLRLGAKPGGSQAPLGSVLMPRLERRKGSPQILTSGGTPDERLQHPQLSLHRHRSPFIRRREKFNHKRISKANKPLHPFPG